MLLYVYAIHGHARILNLSLGEVLKCEVELRAEVF